MTKLPGRKFLKVTSIIFLVLSSLSLIALVATSFAFSLPLVSALYAFFLGIMGIIYHNNREQAGALRWIAVANFVLLAIAIVDAFLNGRIDGALMTLALEVPLTALYLLGAMKNAKAEIPAEGEPDGQNPSDKEE